MIILNEYLEENPILIAYGIIFCGLGLLILAAVIDSIRTNGFSTTILALIITFVLFAGAGIMILCEAFNSPTHYIECIFDKNITFSAEDMQKYRFKEQRGEIYVYEVLQEKK